MSSRRQFLRDCSLVATAAALTPSAALAQNYGPHGMAARDLRFDRFAAQLNTTFTVRTVTTPIRLVLVETELSPPAADEAEDARNERFSLLFRGPADQPLSQDTYLFDHPRLGRQAIFIVPTPTTDAAHCYYEAIFNRAVHPQDLATQLARAPQRVSKN